MTTQSHAHNHERDAALSRIQHITCMIIGGSSDKPHHLFGADTTLPFAQSIAINKNVLTSTESALSLLDTIYLDKQLDEDLWVITPDHALVRIRDLAEDANKFNTPIYSMYLNDGLAAELVEITLFSSDGIHTFNYPSKTALQSWDGVTNHAVIRALSDKCLNSFADLDGYQWRDLESTFGALSAFIHRHFICGDDDDETFMAMMRQPD
jgi:hypothetical protein